MAYLSVSNTDVVVNQVEYFELPGSPEESYANGQAHVRRTFITPWHLRWAFCTIMLGWTEVRGKGTTKPYLSRKPPEPFKELGPQYSDRTQSWLYATTIESVKGKAPVNKDAWYRDEDFETGPYTEDDCYKYEWAEVVVGYESLSYRVLWDHEMLDDRYAYKDGDVPDESKGNDKGLARYVTKVRHPAAEYLTLPFGVWKWPDNKVAATGSGRIVPSTEILYTWHKIPVHYIPKASSEYLGCVNKTRFDRYPAQTLLYQSFEQKPYRDLTGDLVVDITYKMKYFNPEPPAEGSTAPAKGHNHFLKFSPQSGNPWQFQPLSVSGGAEPATTDGNRPFNEREFADLFRLYRSGAQSTE